MAIATNANRKLGEELGELASHLADVRDQLHDLKLTPADRAAGAVSSRSTVL
jgi:hypothetical protein